MQKTASSVLSLLSYFQVFSYPLKKEEILYFLGDAATETTVKEALELLARAGLIFPLFEYWGLENKPAMAVRRKTANDKAKQQLPRAIRAGRLISRFPFIKAVAISGSLSKNVATAESDFDFFIITERNRLWLARTLLHLFKKLTFLTGRQHCYCMNYFIDEEALLIREKNFFTAIELITIKPVTGTDLLTGLFTANQWTQHYFPGIRPDLTTTLPARKNLVQRITRWLLNNKTGDWTDNHLMRHTISRWHRKTNKGCKSISGMLMGMDAGKHYAKPDPGQLQEKILTRFRLKEELVLRQLNLCTEEQGINP